jgi:glutathione S-transferase
MAEQAVARALLERLGIGRGLTLVQHPVSPFCISIRALLEAGGVPHTLYSTKIWDRRPVIELTGGAYASIPVLVDAGREPALVIYEARDDGQDIARYVDAHHDLGVFPAAIDGLHDLVIQYVEAQVEDVGFRLNDIYFLPALPDVVERTMYVRHKERKFGRGCLEQWRAQQDDLRVRLVELLTPLDRMLGRADFLFGARPVFADYALYGVLGNYTYSGDNTVPPSLANLSRWYTALPEVRLV